MIGFAMCGSFCTHAVSLRLLEEIRSEGYEVLPIMSETVWNTDTRFGRAQELRERVGGLCGREIVHTVVDSEPLGPKTPLDALILCPCTGNTLAKIANGITDTAVCMAAKAHLRGNRPLLIALASNDAMSSNLKNIATMLNRKHVYFVPMVQDDPLKKPHSLVSDFSLLRESFALAMEGKQLLPLFR